jgi:hypothetical protein
MQTLIERIEGFVPVVHTRVTRNDDAYRETEIYFRESLEALLTMLTQAEHEQRQRLIRDDIDDALRRYHQYCIEEGTTGAHYREVGATKTDFEHVVPNKIIRGLLIDGRITIAEAFNAPTCELSKDKHKEIGRLGWGGSTPSIKNFWKRYAQVYPDIQIETCDGHVVDLTTWDLEQHYKYFKI